MNYLKPCCGLFSGMGVSCILLLFLGLMTLAYAETVPDQVSGSVKNKNYPNQGFMKEPPKGLVEMFPMCEEFLDVHWINKKFGVGYVKHDLYKDGEITGVMESLVMMNTKEKKELRPWDRLELYDFRRENKVESLFEKIREGYISTWPESVLPNVKYYGETIVLQRNNSEPEYTYSDNRKIVCVLYPESKRVWLVEYKRVDKVYDRETIKSKIKIFKQSIPLLDDKLFDSAYMLDVNKDGSEDYIIDYYLWISDLNRYNLVKIQNYKFDESGEYKIFGINEKLSSCKVYNFNMYFITVFKERYLLNNQCDLTDISSR